MSSRYTAAVNTSDLIFLGTGGHVVALDKFNGTLRWKTKLKGGLGVCSFVTIMVEGNYLFAHTGGELFCLELASGKMLWKNDLPGLGYGLGMLATEENCSAMPPLIAQETQNRSDKFEQRVNEFDLMPIGDRKINSHRPLPGKASVSF